LSVEGGGVRGKGEDLGFKVYGLESLIRISGVSLFRVFYCFEFRV
jgi:hypothetical protein